MLFSRHDFARQIAQRELSKQMFARESVNLVARGKAHGIVGKGTSEKRGAYLQAHIHGGTVDLEQDVFRQISGDEQADELRGRPRSRAASGDEVRKWILRTRVGKHSYLRAPEAVEILERKWGHTSHPLTCRRKTGRLAQLPQQKSDAHVRTAVRDRCEDSATRPSDPTGNGCEHTRPTVRLKVDI